VTASSDIFIVGGGINGVGMAADAASRGLSVTLCEKNDIASGTSSASTKLIHGGLRYLENFEFSLVRKALREREILWHNAKHIISPLEFILPWDKKFRPAWFIRCGLFIYDHLTWNSSFPRSRKIKLSEDVRGKALQSRFKTGFSYFDCMTDDARLTLLNAIAAKEQGATLLTQTTFLSAKFSNNRWQIQLKANNTDQIFTYYATALVNAAGPWINQVQNRIENEKKFDVNLVKGSHIIVRKLYEGHFAYLLQNPDKRIIFAIPYQNEFTLIGTTDVCYTEDIDHVKISPDEIRYLCDTINYFFKHPVKLTESDVIFSYAGVRCLLADDVKNPAKISRDYHVHSSESLPLLTVLSGKITTYRRLAEESIEKLRPFFPQMKKSKTQHTPLPGGDFFAGDFSRFCEKALSDYSWLPEKIVARYTKNYGTRMHMLLDNATSLADLGKHFGHTLYQNEVNYLIQYEWARTAEDILWRRTKLGLLFSADECRELENYTSKFLIGEILWQKHPLQ